MKKKRESEIKEFYIDSKFVVWAGIIAFGYCVLCTVFKASARMNVPEVVRPWGDLFYNVAISVIAAVIFYVVQVYLVNHRRDKILHKYAKRYTKEGIIKECNMLITRMDKVKEGTDEANIREAISKNCDKIQSYISVCMSHYVNVLPVECVDNMNAIIFDDFFYAIDNRAKMYLKNESMKQIINTPCLYDNFKKLVSAIEKSMENY